MHQLVTDLPEMREFDKRRAKADADREEMKAKEKLARDNYQRALTETPLDQPAPLPPENLRVQERYWSLVTQIDADRTRFFTENADSIAASLVDREAEILAEVDELIARLDALAVEMGDIARSLQEVCPFGSRPVGFGGTDLAITLIKARRQGARFFAEPVRVEFAGRI